MRGAIVVYSVRNAVLTVVCADVRLIVCGECLFAQKRECVCKYARTRGAYDLLLGRIDLALVFVFLQAKECK